MLDDPAIVLVILIPEQLFIEEADAIEQFTSETSVGYGIHFALSIRSGPEMRIAHA